jgi:zinc protease
VIGPVVLVEPGDDVPVVSGTVALRVGAALDPPGREGLARLCARLLRRGAWGWNAAAVDGRIAALGAELWTEVSAFSTFLHFRVVRRAAERFVELVSTLLARPTFEPDEILRLKHVTMAELVAARQSDTSLAERALRRMLFCGLPQGRSVLGTPESLAAISADDLGAHHRRAYVRANAVVAISGDVSADEGEKLALRLLALLPDGAPAPAPPAPGEPARGRRLVFVDKPRRALVPMVVGGLAGHARDDDYVPLLVANTAFGGTFSSRLVQEVRVKRSYSYGVASRLERSRHRETFAIESMPSAQRAAACLALELELLEALCDRGLDDDEVAFAKSYLRRSHPMTLDTPRKRVERPLQAALFDLPEGFHASYLPKLRKVTRRAASTAAAVRLPVRDLVIAVVGTYEDVGEAIERAIPGLADVTRLSADFD